MVLDTTNLCFERARSLCDALGASGEVVMMAAVLAVAFARERFKRYQEAKDAEAKTKAAEAKIAAVKAERNEHAALAQDLKVQLASLRPPPGSGSGSLEPGATKRLPPDATLSMPPWLETRDRGSEGGENQ